MKKTNLVVNYEIPFAHFFPTSKTIKRRWLKRKISAVEKKGWDLKTMKKTLQTKDANVRTKDMPIFPLSNANSKFIKSNSISYISDSVI